LFSRLFSRKTHLDVNANSPNVARIRTGNGGSVASSNSPRGASPPPTKPRFPATAAGIGSDDASTREQPLAVDTQQVVATGESATTAEKGPVEIVPSKGPVGRPERSHQVEEPVKATKMAPQEELSIKISEGLKSLSTVLGAIDEKLASQTRTA